MSPNGPLDRRGFLRLLAGAAALAGGGYALHRGLLPEADMPVPPGSHRPSQRSFTRPLLPDQAVPSTCDHDCGGRCLMYAHVREGRVVRLSTDTGADPVRTCTRGRAYRHHLDAPDRLLSPMWRTGPRGSGVFRAIGWDEALDRLASGLRAAVARHGPATIFCGPGSGSDATLNATFQLQMLLARLGGFTSGWSSPSWEGARFAMQYTTGLNGDRGPSDYADGSDAEDILRSKLAIFWGFNPANTHFGSHTKRVFAQAREAGLPIICVDPIYTDTAALWGTEWIPIRPGSDAAVLLAMSHTILAEGLTDASYVALHVEGQDALRDHLFGRTDGVLRDPRWASALSGVPAETIAGLARRYAEARPAKLIAGYAPGRSAFGEQYHRAALALQALTGNIGRPGGGGAGNMVGRPTTQATLVGEAWSRFVREVEVADASLAMIATTRFADAVEAGRRATPAAVGSYKPLPSDITVLYAAGWNPVNQLPNVARTLDALRRLDLIVVQDQRMTPTARYADLLLPACTMLERDDIAIPWRGNEQGLFPQARAVAPRGLSRPDHVIFADVALRLGLEPIGPVAPPREVLDMLLARNGHPRFAAVVADPTRRPAKGEPFVAFREQIERPDIARFATPSGRIELRSGLLSGMDFRETSYGQAIPAVPTHLENAEGPSGGPGALPLQLLTTKGPYRCHSTFTGNPALEALHRQSLWIHPGDAAARGVAEGAAVEVYNARGRLRVPARLTERIRPGVVMLWEGAWYDPDAEGICLGGNPNVLTSEVPSPGGAYALNTSRVEVRPIG